MYKLSNILTQMANFLKIGETTHFQDVHKQ